GRQPDRLPQRAGRRAPPGRAARASAGDATVGPRRAPSRGCRRRCARVLRDRERTRQPHAALVPHAPASGERAREGSDGDDHGLVDRRPDRPGRRRACVRRLRLAARRGSGRSGPARGDELRRSGHRPLPRARRRLMRRLLSYRDVRLLVTGHALSAFGDWAMWIVLAVWMKTLTGSSARAGLVFFVLGLGNLAGPLGGLLADRVKRRPLMIVCDVVHGTSVLVLLFLHDASEAWLIYLVAFLYGIVGSVFYPARSALLRLMLPEELLAEANGVLS